MGVSFYPLFCIFSYCLPPYPIVVEQYKTPYCTTKLSTKAKLLLYFVKIGGLNTNNEFVHSCCISMLGNIVFFNSIFVAIAFVTKRTFELLYSGVFCHVAFKWRHVHKSLVTYRASVAEFSVMSVYMFIEVKLGHQASATNWTFVCAKLLEKNIYTFLLVC